MKLWHSLLLCLIFLCAPSVASQINTSPITIAGENSQYWFLYDDSLVKFDGHTHFDAQQLTQTLAPPFLSILEQPPFLWVGHQNGLSRVNTRTSESRTWLQSPVSKIRQTTDSIIFQSKHRLYQLKNSTISLLPIDLQAKLWQTSKNGLTFISQNNELINLRSV